VTQRHLVGVWNPSYADDVMDAHLTLLLARMRSLREASSDDRSREDPDQAVSVWWGKVRSPNRLQPLPHLDEILALDDAARDAAQEVHLYLTDYRSLYVGHVVEITTDDVMESDDDDVPPYYRKAGLRSDCWFRLADIRRLVATLDIPVRQVLIEARIVIVNDDFSRDLGVRAASSAFSRFASSAAGPTLMTLSCLRLSRPLVFKTMSRA
jgi:hypothetical protein